MRKIIYGLLALAAVAMLAACGSGSEGVVVDPNASSGQPAQNSQGGTEVSGGDVTLTSGGLLFYQSGDVKIYPYDLADEVLASLGEPTGTFESASCAYQGMDYFYYYDGFQLTVNDVDGAKHVTVITVADDTVSIPQGVKIGSTEEEMKQLMGDSYTESSGLYVFTELNTTLQITIKEGKVASIVYIYTPPTA